MVRRWVALCNLLAFGVFVVYPTMPPRLLPGEYGFVDTVRRESAGSVWMEGGWVNQLAAMPSMHFGYAGMVGAVCLFHAGVCNRVYKNTSSWGWKAALIVAGVGYPGMVLVTIIATANHVSCILFAA